MKYKTLFAINSSLHNHICSELDIKRVEKMCDIINVSTPEKADKQFLLDNIAEADIVITSWGTENLDADVIKAASKLKLLTHAAGSVKPVVSDALWDKKVQVTSAAAAIAYGVAEFCLGMMLTASKRVYWASEGMKRGLWQEDLAAFNGPNEIYQQKVGIIGASHVGRRLIELLKFFSCDVYLYDPYFSESQAKAIGATKVESLEDIFFNCKFVSLNAPLTDSTAGMIRGKHFELLQDGAVFINSARAAIVNHTEMIDELAKGRFVACIDVTDPEPTKLDDPLRTLPNVILTPHVAGAIAENRLRIGTFAINEIEAFVSGKPLIYEIKREMLEHIG